MDGMQFQLSETGSQKLTSWKKEPSIQALKQDFEAARPSHDAQMADITRWTELMAVKGDAKPPKIKGQSSVQPKLIRRQAEWRYSALSEPFLSSQKIYKVSPTTWEDEQAAKQNETVLNWQWRTKWNKVKFIDDYVRAAVDEGTVIVRTGWKRVTVPVKQQVPVWTHVQIQTPQQSQALEQAISLKQENPHGFEDLDPALKEAVSYYEESGTPTVAMQTDWQEVTTEQVIENRPTVEVLHPQNVTIDPSSGGDMDKALFAIVSFETNKAELLKEGKRYKNLDRVNWQGNAPITDSTYATQTPQTFQFNDAARKKVVAHEYWGFYDIHGDGVLVSIVATWIGDVLIRMEENPFPDGKLPFVVATYMPIKRALYGEPDAELLEDSQRISGAVTRGMIDLMGKSANGQRGYAKGMLDALNRRRYEDGKDYEFNPGMNPLNGVIEHKYPEIPQSALTMLTMMNQEAEALTGVKSFSGGISGQAYGDVATGIRGALDAASKREMAILRRLAKGMTEIGTKIIAMNAVFLSDKEVIRVTNEEYVTINRDDLKGNFDLETDISTVEVDNAKAQDMGFMLQTIGPNAGPEISMMVMAEIAELKRMPVLAHKLRTYKPQPDPLAEQMKQLELQKAQMEVQLLQAQAELNHAKAQQANTEADLNNLDFVEQETGTKHARDMQKQQGQSQGNQNLVVTKALATPKKEGESAPNVNAAIGFNQISHKLAGV